MAELFYHVALMGKYKPIISQQMRDIIVSGFLNDPKNKMRVCYVSKQKRNKHVKSLIPNQKNIEIKYVGRVLNYEYPTLKILQEESRQDVVGYFHTKGVSKPNDFHGGWRRSMMKHVISNWKSCLFTLDYYDCCGWDWCKSPINFNIFRQLGVSERMLKSVRGFYAGNFWWSTAEYINTLPKVDSLDWSNRYNAELWIGLSPNKPKIFCMKSNKPL